MSTGTPFIIGAVVSTTVTVNDLVVVLQAASFAVQATVVVPSGKVEPDAGVHANDVTPTASVALVVKLTSAPPGPIASRVMSAGTVTDGAVVSWTVTWNDACAEFERASVAVQFTVVVPTGKPVPEAGTHVTGTVPSTRSLAVGFV